MTSAIQPGIASSAIADRASSPHMKYRPDIDGLRAIAVISVVIFHAFPNLLPSGFIGVDIFFVISGFLISTILYDELRSDRFSIIRFYERRINRIFPALLIILITCYAFGWFVLFADEYSQLGKHVFGGSTFISNFLLWDERGYFDTTSDVKPLLHLWSLGIEEQFYIFWPIILAAAWRLRANLLGVVAVLAAVSFTLNMKKISIDQSATFYLPHTRAWELLIGAFAAIYVKDRQPGGDLGAGLSNALSIVGFLLISLAFVIIKDGDAFPGWQATLPTIGTAMVILAGPSAVLNRAVLSTKPFVWVGLISFPLYLWHWPALSFPRIINGETPDALVRIVAVGLSIALATATYLLVEKPLKGMKGKAKPALLLVTVFTLGGLGLWTYANNGLPSRPPIAESKDFQSQFVGPIWKYAKNDICVKRVNFPAAQSYLWWFCITNQDKSPDVLIIGSSTANHLYPGIAQLPEMKDKTVLSIGACSIQHGEKPNESPETNSPCSGSRAYDQRKLIDKIIAESPSIKHIIIGGLGNSPAPGHTEAIKRRLTNIVDSGATVTIVTPYITKQGDLKNCYARPLSAVAADCKPAVDAREKLEAFNQPLWDEIHKEFPNIKFFDPNNVFCKGNDCSFIIDGMPIFRDQYTHFSEYASKIVGRAIYEDSLKDGVDLAK